MHGLRSTIALVVVLGGLLGYIYFVTWKTAPTDTTSKQKVFASLEADKIAEIRIKGSSGDTTTLRRTNGQWAIVEPLTTPADTQIVTSMTSALASLDATRVVDENPANLADYGLAPPRIEVSFKSDGAKDDQRILIGERSPAGGDLFAMRGGEKRVVLVAGVNEAMLDHTTFQLRDKTVIRFDRDKVDGIEIAGGEKPILLSKAGGDWKLLKPIESTADFGTVEALLGRMQTAQMRSVVTSDASPADLKKYGLDKPVHTVTLSAGSARATIALGSPADDLNTFARDALSPMVVTVEKAVAEELDKTIDDYRRKDLFDFRTFNANRIEIVRAGGQPVVFELLKGQFDAADKWQRVSPTKKEVERDPMDSLLSKLSMMRATGFVDSTAKTGLDAPTLSVDVTFEDAKKQEHVIFGKAGDGVYASRPGIPGAAKVDATDFAEALKTLEELSK